MGSRSLRSLWKSGLLSFKPENNVLEFKIIFKSNVLHCNENGRFELNTLLLGGLRRLDPRQIVYLCTGVLSALWTYLLIKPYPLRTLNHFTVPCTPVAATDHKNNASPSFGSCWCDLTRFVCWSKARWTDSFEHCGPCVWIINYKLWNLSTT